MGSPADRAAAQLPRLARPVCIARKTARSSRSSVTRKKGGDPIVIMISQGVQNSFESQRDHYYQIATPCYAPAMPQAATLQAHRLARASGS